MWLDLDQLVQFWEFAARLKAEPRRGWLKKLRLQRTESVADHSFALSLLCLFEGERRSYNVERLLKLALLHDLEEAITGDLTPQDKESSSENLCPRTIDFALSTGESASLQRTMVGARERKEQGSTASSRTR